MHVALGLTVILWFFAPTIDNGDGTETPTSGIFLLIGIALAIALYKTRPRGPTE